jgi:hypothetical protein
MGRLFGCEFGLSFLPVLDWRSIGILLIYRVFVVGDRMVL